MSTSGRAALLRFVRHAAAPVLLLVASVLAAASVSSLFAPGGQLFALIALVSVAYACGLLVEYVFSGPALLGQMVAGLVIRNVAAIDFTTPIPSDLASTCRSLAATVLLLRAGLGMNIPALRRSPALVLRLAALPNLTEAALASVLLHVLLDIPYIFGIMGGFILSAVSPAVVVPLLLQLQDLGYGVAKGIPTLVLAAASFDDVLSISGFGVALGIGLSTGDSTAWVAVRGPVELAAGAAYGAAAGLLLGRYVLRGECGDGGGVSPRLCAATALSVGSVAVLGGKALGFSGGGAFAVIVFGLCLQLAWNGQQQRLHANPCTASSSADEVIDSPASATAVPACITVSPDVEASTVGKAAAEASTRVAAHIASTRAWRAAVSLAMKHAWSAVQPMLFATLGAGVELGAVELRFVGLVALIAIVALVVRSCVTFGVLSCESFLNTRERMFVTLAWLPKATVQAALGSQALDATLARGASDGEVRAARLLLKAAVLSVLLTAPLGALAIAVSGPKLLSRGGPEETEGGEPTADEVLVPHAGAGDEASCSSAGSSAHGESAQVGAEVAGDVAQEPVAVDDVPPESAPCSG